MIASITALAPRYEPPIPITISTSALFLIYSADSLILANSSLSYSVGRLIHPKKSLPSPVLFIRVAIASTALGAIASTSAGFTIPFEYSDINLNYIF